MKRVAKFLTVRISILLVFGAAIAATFYPGIRDIFLAFIFSIWIINVHRDKIIES